MTFLKLMLLAACIVSPAAFAQSPDTTETEPGWSVAVIKLQYASAEEIAPLLQAILPPGVTIVPYYPTNSLIIAGDPAVIGRLKAGDEEVESEAPPD